MQGISGIILLDYYHCMFIALCFTLIFRNRHISNQRIIKIHGVLAKTTGLAARANAVQQNSFERLPLFIAALLMAEYMVVP